MESKIFNRLATYSPFGGVRSALMRDISPNISEFLHYVTLPLLRAHACMHAPG